MVDNKKRLPGYSSHKQLLYMFPEIQDCFLILILGVTACCY